MNIFYIFAFLCVSYSRVSGHWEHEKYLRLRLSQVLFRHGDRNPINPYPKDPYKNESFWPEGYGQLTKIGKMQQFKLGQFLRNRYNSLVNSSYSPYEIHVWSSNVDRALMSAEANLAGFYPPNDNQSIWNDGLKWQPIPVHSIPTSEDNKLKMSAPCPRYDQLYKDLFQTDEIKNLDKESKPLYDYLSLHSGQNISKPEDVDFLFDTLRIERIHNYTLPDWTNDLFKNETLYDQMIKLTLISFKMISYTTEMKRLKGGPFLQELIKNMFEKKGKIMDERRKLIMYSGHDTTVASILNTLDVFELHIIPYAVLTMFDLYENITSGDYYVKISYRNVTTEDPFVLRIPGCETYCLLENFQNLTKSMIPSDWNSECKPLTSIYDALGITMGLVVVFSIFTFLFALSIIFGAYLRNKKKNPNLTAYPYLHLQMEDEEA